MIHRKISTHRRLTFLALSLVATITVLTLLSSKDSPGVSFTASGHFLSGLSGTSAQVSAQRKASSQKETAIPARSPMQNRAAQKVKPTTRGGVRRSAVMPAILSTYYEWENGRSTSSGIPFDDDKLTVAVHYPSRAWLQYKYIAIENGGKIFGLTPEDKIQVTDRFMSKRLERSMGTRYTHRLDCSPKLKQLITGVRGGLTPGAKFWVIDEPKKVAK